LLPKRTETNVALPRNPDNATRQLERMAGRMFCVSFAAPQDLATCLRIGQSVMLDNGAFSVKTRGIAFDMAGFYAWIEPHLGHPHWAVVPDEIGGTVEQQRAMDAWDTTTHQKNGDGAFVAVHGRTARRVREAT
jgi:hypothetical protein